MRDAFRRSWPLMVAVITASGCGGTPPDGRPRESVSGTVTLDGQPIAAGSITFLPDGFDGPPVGAAIQEGAYSVPAQNGPVPGIYRVSIFRQMPTGKTTPDPDDASAVLEERFETIPESYNVRTTLKAEVKAGGSNRFPFEVEGEIKTPPPANKKKSAPRRR